MPILSVFFGIIVRMWHGDHPPPHIHAEYQGFEALVQIPTGQVFVGKLPRKVAAIVQEWCFTHQQELLDTGNDPNVSSRWSAFREPIMIKLLEAHYRSGHQIDLVFSDGRHGVFNVKTYLTTRHGLLLGPLQDEIYLQRFFIDAGALCWPNGLELSPARLHEISVLHIAA